MKCPKCGCDPDIPKVFHTELLRLDVDENELWIDYKGEHIRLGRWTEKGFDPAVMFRSKKDFVEALNDLKIRLEEDLPDE